MRKNSKNASPALFVVCYFYTSSFQKQTKFKNFHRKTGPETGKNYFIKTWEQLHESATGILCTFWPCALQFEARMLVVFMLTHIELYFSIWKISHAQKLYLYWKGLQSWFVTKKACFRPTLSLLRPKSLQTPKSISKLVFAGYLSQQHIDKIADSPNYI